MPDEDAEIMLPYEDYSVEELKEAFKRVFFLSELNDADLAEIEQILAVLREKDPLPPSRSVDETWAEFQSIYQKDPMEIGIHGNDDSEEVVDKKPEPVVVVDDAPSEKNAPHVLRKRHGNLFRIGLIAAILVALLVAVTATASAMGFNLWGWLPVWSDEDVRFVAEDTEKPYGEFIPDVLKRLGIEELLYPTWLPEDLTRTDVRIFEEPLTLHEKYCGNNRELTITISPTASSENTIYQKTDNPPKEYPVGGVVHYIFGNTDEITAVWYTESYTTTIVGTISLEEMKKIIDSVYEVT